MHDPPQNPTADLPLVPFYGLGHRKEEIRISRSLWLYLLLFWVCSHEWPFSGPLPSHQCHSHFFMLHMGVARPLGYKNSRQAFQCLCILFLRMFISLQKCLKSPRHWLYFFKHISLSIELFSKEVCSYFIDIIWGNLTPFPLALV